jgi:hypothetical protein
VDKEGKLNYLEFVNVLKNELSGGSYRREEDFSYGGGGRSAELEMGLGPPVAALQMQQPQEPPREATATDAASDAAIQMIQAKYATLSKGFENGDRRQTGFLEEKEIRRLCGIYHVKLEIIERALGACDTGGNGKVSYIEFLNQVKRIELKKQGYV